MSDNIPVGTLRVRCDTFGIEGKDYIVEIRSDPYWTAMKAFSSIRDAERFIKKIKAGKIHAHGWTRIYPPPV